MGIYTCDGRIRHCHFLHDGMYFLCRFYLSKQALAQFAAFFLAFKGVENVAHVEGRPIRVTDIFANSIFRDIVISILSTLGLYLIASLIHVGLLS